MIQCVYGDTMDYALESQVYYKKIMDLLNKKGDKINYNGYLINAEDQEEFDGLLTIENILFNKKMLLESTNALRNSINERLNNINDDALLEKEALVHLKEILDLTPKTPIENLTICRKILVPKEHKQLYLNNINKTVIGRFKPLRDASKEDLEDLTLDMTLLKNQRSRIKDYNKDTNNVSLDELVDDLGKGIESLRSLKEEVLSDDTYDIESLDDSPNMEDYIVPIDYSEDAKENIKKSIKEPKLIEKSISPYENQLNEYKEYLRDHYKKAVISANETGKIYYEEMINRLDKNNLIEEPGYLMQN